MPSLLKFAVALIASLGWASLSSLTWPDMLDWPSPWFALEMIVWIVFGLGLLYKIGELKFLLDRDEPYGGYKGWYEKVLWDFLWAFLWFMYAIFWPIPLAASIWQPASSFSRMTPEEWAKYEESRDDSSTC